MSDVLTARPPASGRAAVTHHVKVAVLPAAGGPLALIEHPGSVAATLVTWNGDTVTWEFRNYTADDLDLGIANFRAIDPQSADPVPETHPFGALERLGVRVERNGGRGQFTARALGTEGRPRRYTYDIVAWTTLLSGSGIEIKA